MSKGMGMLQALLSKITILGNCGQSGLVTHFNERRTHCHKFYFEFSVHQGGKFVELIKAIECVVYFLRTFHRTNALLANNCQRKNLHVHTFK